MNRILPLLILAVGVVISASFGARLGDQHAEYRVATANVGALEADDPAREAAEARLETLSLPEPDARVAQWFSAGGLGWLLGSGLILVGAVLARRQIAAEQAGGDGTGNQADFAGAVAEALAAIDRIEPQLAALPMDTDCEPVRIEIDTLMDLRLGPLVDARGQLIARHGLAAFAEYFGPFSAGERNLARVWSTVTDGHSEEARKSLVSAKASFEQAAANWAQVEGA